MSQIAAALARSKGKKVDPVAGDGSVVPEIHTSTPPMPAKPQPAVEKKLPLKLIAITASAISVLAVGGWLVFRSAPPPVAAAPARPIVAPVAAKPPPLPAKVSEAPKPVEPEIPLPPTTMSPALEKQLADLVISARRTGADQRIVIGKKMFAPGDTVIEGATLDEVLHDRVIFRDTEGHRFERRY